MINSGMSLVSSPIAEVNNVIGSPPTTCSSSLTQMLVQKHTEFLNSTNHQQAVHKDFETYLLSTIIQKIFLCLPVYVKANKSKLQSTSIARNEKRNFIFHRTAQMYSKN